MSSGGGWFLPLAGILTGFCLVVFMFLPLIDRYFTNRRSWVSGIVDRILVHKTKFLPGLAVEERRQVLEHMFQKRNLRNDDSQNTEIVKLDESTTPTVLETTDEHDRVESATIPCDKVLYNLEDGSKAIHSDDDVCVICLEPYDAEGGTSFATGGTQCSHIYHKDCILQWMEKRDICPFCRKDMFTENEFKSNACSILGPKRVNELSISIPGSNTAANA